MRNRNKVLLPKRCYTGRPRRLRTCQSVARTLDSRRRRADTISQLRGSRGQGRRVTLLLASPDHNSWILAQAGWRQQDQTADFGASSSSIHKSEGRELSTQWASGRALVPRCPSWRLSDSRSHSGSFFRYGLLITLVTGPLPRRAIMMYSLAF
jgi:hypothetical protein